MRSSILACAVAYAACSPFTSTEPGPVEPTTDAGADTGTGVIADGGASGDAGTEAGTPTFAPSCTGTPRFEDAFDRAVPLAKWWTDREVSAPLAPVIDPTLGLPPPSLRVETPFNDGTGDLVNRLYTDLTATTWCLELDTRIDTDPASFDPDSYAEIVAVNSSDNQTRIYVEVTQVGLRLATSSGQYGNLVGHAFGAWAHLVLRVDLTTGDVSAATTDRDGTPQPPVGRTVPARTVAPPTVIRLGLLTGSTGNPRTTAPPVKALIDNVRLVIP